MQGIFVYIAWLPQVLARELVRALVRELALIWISNCWNSSRSEYSSLSAGISISILFFRIFKWLISKPLTFNNHVGHRYRKYVRTCVIRPWVIFECKILHSDRREAVRVIISIAANLLAEVGAVNNQKVGAWDKLIYLVPSYRIITAISIII